MLANHNLYHNKIGKICASLDETEKKQSPYSNLVSNKIGSKVTSGEKYTPKTLYFPHLPYSGEG